MTEIIEGTAVETGTELATTEPAGVGLFHTNDPVEVVEKAARVADALADVINRKHLFTMIQGKAHIGVEGWQLLGSMLGVTAVVTRTEKIDEATWKATVEARDQTGRVIGAADALCSQRERRGPWKNADDYARCSMAQTRATSKALKGPLGFIVSLAGYEATPAEEMTFVEPDAERTPSPAPAQADQNSSSSGQHARGAMDGAPRAETSMPAAKRPEVSEDPWPDSVIARVKEYGVQKDVRDKLAEFGVQVPKGAHVAPVLPRLNAEQRKQVDAWLGAVAEKTLMDSIKTNLKAEDVTKDQAA